jgi:hypothetical protein
MSFLVVVLVILIVVGMLLWLGFRGRRRLPPEAFLRSAGPSALDHRLHQHSHPRSGRRLVRWMMIHAGLRRAA